MSILRDRFEGLWSGELAPEGNLASSPLFVGEEVADRTWFVSSFANATAIATDAGLVLIDTGSFVFSTQVFLDVRSWSQAGAHAAIFTHGHVDHCFGVEKWEAESKERGLPLPRVYAHENTPERFRRYERTRGWNGCINARQFQSKFEWPIGYRYPDVTYADKLALDVGGERIELHHARGETDDATWVWVPGRKLLCTGDLFLWVTPNAGNPQKVQRYALEWAVALRTMAALEAEVLCPGHGVPIWGRERVRRALTETAELLEHLHDRTVELMNQGARLDDIVHAVKAPARLLERPYLQPLYDEPEFIVRNVYRLYGGWWDGNPATLQPAPTASLAREVAGLAGGAARLVERAQALSASGEHALACHLAELAGEAAPRDEGIWRARALVYAARAQAARSLMARGVYLTASEERRRG